MNGLELAEHVQKNNFGDTYVFLSSFDSYLYAAELQSRSAGLYPETEMEIRAGSFRHQEVRFKRIHRCGTLGAREKKNEWNLLFVAGRRCHPQLLASTKFPSW